MAKEKVANYSEKAVETLKTYNSEAGNKAEVTRLAQAVGKSEASVRAKLSSMGLYVKEAKVTTVATASKEVLAANIANRVEGMTEAETEALRSTTKVVLQRVLTQLIKDQTVAEAEAEGESESES